MTDANEDIIHLCLQAQGDAPDCNNCPLQKRFCPQLLITIEKFHGKMRKDLPWLSLQSRKDILQEGVTAVISEISNLKCAGAFQGWTWRIFSNKRDEFLRNQGRNARLNGYLSTPPDNIADLCNTYDKYITWSQSSRELHLECSRLPHSICKILQVKAIFGDEDSRKEWQRLVDRLYRYSLQPIFTDIDPSIPEFKRDLQTDEKEQDELEHDELLHVFNLIEGKQAQNCKTLFKQLLDNDHDRQKVCELRNQTEDALKKQISRCYRLYRKKILDILQDIPAEQGRFCFSLFSELFEKGKSGLQQAIEKFTEESGEDAIWVSRQIRRCRILALRTIGVNHA